MAKYIGQTNDDYVNGEYYPIQQRPMQGRLFKPGKDLQGKWLDTIGEPDTRIMVWKDVYGPEAKPAMKVYESQEAINQDFEV